ncbi:hypothetical protein EJ05DRAFT_479260 [Pseudovirgaria hyperparasitica]|uniref:Uncharacterized protein n=1 Tax=Pseudovirgaria hyperparasitica TaxID=470096 RepID=A0A6A6W1B6_9PEZI|nr:uncharacterized protein EJ05DRAFT_479260 [Pseudovirgaria hyperparasitica]KAF2754841.1 hypothetical protein EJ05DRAFT_479260 [Pseudovirgaria hyperparasitica]
MTKLLFFLAALTSLSTVNGFTLSPYGSAKCSGRANGKQEYNPGDGCRREFAGVTSSVVIQRDDAKDNNHVVVFFKSDDCRPDEDNIIVWKDDKGCQDVGYGSFEVWDLGDLDG